MSAASYSLFLNWLIPVCVCSFSPEEKPLDPSDDQWWFPDTFSHVDLLPSPSVPFSPPASPWATPLRAPRTRSSWRRARGAAAYRPYKTNGYRNVRAPVFRRPGRGGGSSSNCGRWSYMPDICSPRRYKPHYTSWEHIPVVIQATKWYQVVGSMQCSHCSDQGRHQMTSWMCQSCQVPLCLMPYRNCYAKWHSQWCWAQLVGVTFPRGKFSQVYVSRTPYSVFTISKKFL